MSKIDQSSPSCLLITSNLHQKLVQKKGDLNLKSVKPYSAHTFKSFVSPQMQLYDSTQK